jgi:hypothetical protein
MLEAIRIELVLKERVEGLVWRPVIGSDGKGNKYCSLDIVKYYKKI